MSIDIAADKKEIIKLVEKYYEELSDAVHRVTAATIPWTPFPRIRRFALRMRGVTIFFSGFEKAAWRYYPSFSYSDGRQYYSAKDIVEVLCEYQPSRVMAYIRFLRSITNWCNKRAEGRTRAAGEILCQQGKALAELEAEIALSKLGG